MWISLGLSVALLVNVPFLGRVDVKKLFRRHAHPTAADSLPPPWRNASRLALENSFVRAELPQLTSPGGSLRLNSDPRNLHVQMDPSANTLRTAPEFGDVEIGAGAAWPLTSYGGMMMSRNFRRAWNLRSQSNLNSLGANTPASTTAPSGGIHIPLGRLPAGIAPYVGTGGPAINVRGSENIRISGTSNWTNQQVGPQGQKRSLFPTLDMQQDLDIQLEGQLSDRIRVNLLQNSANQIPLSNRIAINYRGDEDALFQQIDLGNTNLTLPGTQYVSYSGKNEGLFGMKATSRIGPLDFTLLASKQEGRSERASYGGGASKQTTTVRDVEYIRGVYFFLTDPSDGPYDVSEATLRVYRDDNNSTFDVNVVRGIALPDPFKLAIALNPPPPDTANNPLIPDSTTLRGPLNTGPVAVRGQFDLLAAGTDYELLGDVYGTGWKILRLNQPVTGSQRLAVTYERRPLINGTTPGNLETVGGSRVRDVDSDSSLVMKLLHVPPDVIGPSGSGTEQVYDSTSALFPTIEFEARNFYNLGGQHIEKTSFKLTIRKGNDQPPKVTASTGSGLIPYVEILGLDNLDETQDPPLRAQHGVNSAAGHDGQVDGTLLNSAALRVFVDFENGTLFFPEPRPFAPRLGPTGRPFDRAVSAILARRDSLAGASQTDTEPNPLMYQHYVVQGDVDARFFMDLEFTAARATGEISLGRGNLLEGSEVVTVSGQTWQRGRDYDIDYDLGRLTLKRQLGPADNLNVDYSYAPLFQQAGRTLIGSAFSLQGRDRSLGGAFMYESRGAQDLRPRLGEEPARSLIGDVNADWTVRPQWLTRAVDLLPGVRTTAPSEFRVQAEMGASFPNPNTRNQVYIDDMEGVRDAISLSMDQSHWRWSSVPKLPIPRNAIGVPPAFESMLEIEDRGGRYKNAETHWYTPYAVVKERDLKPLLEEGQGAQNTRPALALAIPRRPKTANSSDANYDSLWAGLTYVLDPTGIDVTKSQFIELWVNDFNDHHDPAFATPRVRGRNVKLHIDLGKVSEDQMRAPDERPNGLKDTEDRGLNPDGQLDVTGKFNEDTGLDGLLNSGDPPSEQSTIPLGPNGIYRDLVASTSTDPEGDDYHSPSEDVVKDFKEEIDARRWLYTNGTEGDKNLYPYPETEDLNLNGYIDKGEGYYEYTVDLSDGQTRYLVTDLQDLKAHDPQYANARNPISIDNGWRRYRIPIDDSVRVQFGTVDLTIAQHVRVWLEGVILPDTVAEIHNKDGALVPVERPLIMLGGVDIVGSRWRAKNLDAEEANAGATMTLNSVNTVDNTDIYEAPFDPGQTRNGNQALTRREQSVAIEFTQLRAGKQLEAFKTFSLDENYSRYGKLDWYVTGFGVHDSMGTTTNQNLYYYIRFTSDELGLNYYEYRAPLPVSSVPGGKAWQEVQLALTELSNLKLKPGYPRDATGQPLRDSLGREILLIREQRSPGSSDSLIIVGRPSFTRLRRVSFGLVNLSPSGYYRDGQMWFDELRALDVAKDRGTAERVSVGGRFANLLTYNLAWNGRDADFISVGETRGSGTATDNIAFSSSIDLHRFFEATGIVLPVAFNFNQGKQRPRYSVGDDIVRDAADQARSETFSDSRAWNVSYSRAWSNRANPFLLYTLGGVTASYATGNNHTRSPSGTDQNTSTSGGVNYSIAPRNLLSVPMPFTKAKLFPLPERFWANYRFDQREGQTADRVIRGDGTDSLVLRAPVSGHSGMINMGADTRPVDFFHHHIEAVRNLNLQSPGLLGVQFGRVVNWSQSNDASWSPRFLPWLRPQFGWSSRFVQNNGPELSPDLTVRAIQNGNQTTVRWELPFGNLARNPVASLVRAPGDTSRTVAKPVGPALWRRLLSRLGTVSADFGMNQASTYSRVRGIPDFFYLFGLRTDANVGDVGSGSRLNTVFGNLSTTTSGWRTGARGNIQLPFSMLVQTSGDFDSRFSTSNGAERGTTQLRFPDVSLDFGQVANVLRLTRLVKNPTIRSSGSRQVSSEFANGRSQKTGSTTLITFRPLLSLSGDLPNGMRLELGTEHRHSDGERFQLGSSLQQDINTDVNLNLSRSYTQGQKISFLGKESTVRSSITIGINSQYSRHTGRILQNGIERNPERRDRLSLNATGSYGFSSNVSGNAVLGFSQDRDLLRALTHRSVRVELSARFGL